MAKQRKSKPTWRKVLRLPDLEQSKDAVINSLPARTSQVSYRHAIEEFISWYCSEPRLAFNRTVVLRYRFFLEQASLAPATINVRLAAVRRLAYEAADAGLLSPELAAGIARVKGAKRLGVRAGRWLTAEQGKALLRSFAKIDLRSLRDRAMVSLLLGCGLRRSELVGLHLEDIQLRDEHWVVADLVGKGRHIRTVPIPTWAKRALDDWTSAAEIRAGIIFRRVSRKGRIWGDSLLAIAYGWVETPGNPWPVLQFRAAVLSFWPGGG